MKLITANKLNRFWQKGIKPILTLLGKGDISSIGDGTVTGAIRELNTGISIPLPTPVAGTIKVLQSYIYKRNGIVHLTMYCQVLKKLDETILVMTLPADIRPVKSYYSATPIYIGSTWDTSLGKAHPFIKIEAEGRVLIEAPKDMYLMVDTTYIAVN